MVELRKVWLRLTSYYTQNNELQEELWQELEQLYTSSGRYYHTLHHLETLLQLAEKYKSYIKHPLLLHLAIFYHDAIYVPSRQDNEEQSAELARKRLQQLGLPNPKIDHVVQLVLATKQHLPQAFADVNLLLDLDLAILGADWKHYLQYSKQIRQEFNKIPEAAYRHGRKQVLSHFLSQRHIYKTEPFRQQLEEQARSNIRKEIWMLEEK